MSILALLTTACESASPPKSDVELQAEIVDKMHALVMHDMKMLISAAQDMQAAAPETIANGWDGSPQGVATMTEMQTAWRRARGYWERVEGTAPLFPELDASMDARYEDLLAATQGAGDPRPFDASGVTGMHAIERILYAPSPGPVITYESTLDGYWEAMWPTTDKEAQDFKNGLLKQLINDSQALLDQWKNRAIDLDIVFMGLTGLIASQEEKVSLAAIHQEESRYSNTTLADMRSNLAGTRDIYSLFTNWLDTKEFGATLNNTAVTAFDVLDGVYTDTPGDAVPAPPPTWNVQAPSPDDLMTPFGILYVAVVQAVDEHRSGSAVDAMNQVASALRLSTMP